MTNYKVEKADLCGENSIAREHIQNNRSVREMLGGGGRGKPEELPVAKDIKKLERRVAAEEKKLEKSAEKLRSSKIALLHASASFSRHQGNDISTAVKVFRGLLKNNPNHAYSHRVRLIDDLDIFTTMTFRKILKLCCYSMAFFTES